MKVYPNPSNGKFVIEVFNEEIKTYSVINLLGATFLKGSVEETKTLIDLSNFPNGIYFLRMNSATNSEIIKLVKE